MEQEQDLESLRFNNNGTKLFIITNENGVSKLLQYRLNTPYDITDMFLGYTRDIDRNCYALSLAFNNLEDTFFTSFWEFDRAGKVYAYNLSENPPTEKYVLD